MGKSAKVEDTTTSKKSKKKRLVSINSEHEEDNIVKDSPKPKSKKIKKLRPDEAKANDNEIETSSHTNEAETEAAAQQQDNGVEKKSPVTNERAKKGYTVFIGNLPSNYTEARIRTLFKQFGTIEAVRFRTNTGAKVKHRKTLNGVTSLNYYVRFSEKEHMQKACSMNGQMVGENRIRVCPDDVKQIGSTKSTVFVGNLRQGTKDNELYNFFESVGEIEYVRQIANRNIAFVCFKKGVSIAKALKLNQQLLNKRPVRVMPVDPTKSTMKTNKKGHLVKKNRLPKQTANTERKDEANAAEVDNDFHGKVVTKGKKKKPKQHRGEKAKKILSQKLKAAMQGKKTQKK